MVIYSLSSLPESRYGVLFMIRLSQKPCRRPVGHRDFPEFHSPSPSLSSPSVRPSAVAVAVVDYGYGGGGAGTAAVIAIHNSENDTATAIRGRRGEGEGRDCEPFQFGSTVRLTAKCCEFVRPKDMESMSPFAASSGGQLHHTIDSMIEK